MADKTISTTVANGKLVIACNGQTLVIDPLSYSNEIREAAMIHGFKQKVCDAAALSRDEGTGKPATPADKLAAMREVEVQLAQGDWNRRATGDGTAGMGLLVAALVRLSGKPRVEVEATVEGWTKEEQAAMRATSAVAPIIAAIKAERGAKGTPVDVSGLLAAFAGPAVATEPKAAKAKKAA